MNSSSVSEKAAVEGTMGNLSFVLQREDPALVTGSVIERLDETMDVISPTKSWVMRYECYVRYKGAAGRKSERASERRRRAGDAGLY